MESDVVCLHEKSLKVLQAGVAADPYCVEGVAENIARRVEAARLFAQDFADSIAPNQLRTRDVHRLLL
jgi:hypothetical protein